MALAMAGLVSDAVGLRPVFFAAALFLIAAGVGGWLLRPLWTIELATAHPGPVPRVEVTGLQSPNSRDE